MRKYVDLSNEELSNKVGNRLFRVPRDAFEKQSEYFKRRFSEHPQSSISGDVEGRLDLTGIEEDAFTDLLRLLYPPYVLSSHLL